jgi:hypothetical protein
MNTNTSTRILVLEFAEIEDEAWAAAESKALDLYRERLRSNPSGSIDGDVSIQNIGSGADWIVVAIRLTEFAFMGFIAIPSAHKKVRESIEEWKRIFLELRNTFFWIKGNKKAIYPDPYLFLTAICHLTDTLGPCDLIYKGCCRIPSGDPDLQNLESLLFSFSTINTIEQVAISRFGDILWHNKIELSASNA